MSSYVEKILKTLRQQSPVKLRQKARLEIVRLEKGGWLLCFQDKNVAKFYLSRKSQYYIGERS